MKYVTNFISIVGGMGTVLAVVRDAVVIADVADQVRVHAAVVSVRLREARVARQVAAERQREHAQVDLRAQIVAT